MASEKRDAKKRKGGRGEKGKETAKVDPKVPSVAAHPRVSRRVRQARDLTGLAAFAIAGLSSLSTHTPLDASLRALISGVVGYLAVWGVALLLSRQLIIAELRQRERKLIEAREAAGEQRGAGAARPGAAGRAR